MFLKTSYAEWECFIKYTQLQALHWCLFGEQKEIMSKDLCLVEVCQMATTVHLLHQKTRWT